MFNFFLNMKVSTKLFLFSLLSVILLACLSLSSFLGLSKQEKLNDSVFSESFQSYVVSIDLIDQIKTINIKAYNVLNMANVGFPDEEIEAAVKPLPEYLDKIEKHIQGIISGMKPENQLYPVYTSTLKNYTEYKKLMLQVINAVTFDTDIAFASLSSAEQFYKQLNNQLVKLKQLEVESMSKKHIHVNELGSSIVHNMTVFSCIIALITLFLGFTMSQSILRPVHRLMAFADGLSGGNLSLRFESKTGDEIGQLGSVMNVMAQQVEEAMDEVKQKAVDAELEAKSAQEAKKHSEVMALQAEEQKQKLLDAAEQLEAMAQALKDSAVELNARTSQVSKAVGEQRDRFAETATAITEMSSTAISIAGNAESSSGEAGQAAAEAEDGVESLQGVIDGIGKVKTNSEGLKVNMTELVGFVSEIGSIIGIISDIADQTNLLALNAAIEAARAGEAGRGFAVVADEVRKLAEKTMLATTDVGKNITSIQESSRRSSAATDEALEAIIKVNEMADGSGELLKEIVHSVHLASDGIHTIATAAEEQSATTEEITRATDDVNELTLTISEEMELTAAATNQVAELADELYRFVEHIRNT
ncbi:methyl-accepting chemotaxis protein [Desulfovibrio sp. UCD-KL4C]|uniref:methyl-accepting chemotaxis protein n=1 Tax=Desulfovibrio sp. UCD-KL4C TaxID=2578120 RepID=UPI0025C0B2D4|nr:methyl-accepting chemotaxis protein [Desulfovibrio sp. UCD-KL4C]